VAAGTVKPDRFSRWRSHRGSHQQSLQSIYRPGLTLHITQKPLIIHWVIFSKLASDQKNKQALCMQIQKAS